MVAKAEDSAPVRRSKSGLAWLLDKEKVSRGEYLTGLEVGEILANAAQAEQPGHGDPLMLAGGTCGKSDVADWRLRAIGARRRLREAVIYAMGSVRGELILGVLEAVCFAGKTVRSIAGGDKSETIRVEERLKDGLGIAREVIDGRPERRSAYGGS